MQMENIKRLIRKRGLANNLRKIFNIFYYIRD